MITVGQVKRLRLGQSIYEIGRYKADGYPVAWRVNGVPQLWKTRPKEFRVPVKYGMYEFGYVDHNNARYFTLKAPARQKVKTRVSRR